MGNPRIAANRSAGRLNVARQAEVGVPDRTSVVRSRGPQVVPGAPRSAVVHIGLRRSVVQGGVVAGAVRPPTSTPIANYLSAAVLSSGRVVCQLADGRVAYASADDLATAENVVGVTQQAANAPDVLIAVAKAGPFLESSWNWPAPAPLFLGLNGMLVTVPDPASKFILQVGAATRPTLAEIRIEEPTFLVGA